MRWEGIEPDPDPGVSCVLALDHTHIQTGFVKVMLVMFPWLLWNVTCHATLLRFALLLAVVELHFTSLEQQDEASVNPGVGNLCLA